MYFTFSHTQCIKKVVCGLKSNDVVVVVSTLSLNQGSRCELFHPNKHFIKRIMEIGLGLGWIALKRKGMLNPHFFQLLLSLTHLTDLNEFVTKRNTQDSKNMPVHGTVCFSLYCNTVHLVTNNKNNRKNYQIQDSVE